MKNNYNFKRVYGFVICAFVVNVNDVFVEKNPNIWHNRKKT